MEKCLREADILDCANFVDTRRQTAGQAELVEVVRVADVQVVAEDLHSFVVLLPGRLIRRHIH